MDDIRQKRLIEGPVLNICKIHYQQSLTKTFGTFVEKSMIFKTLKNKQCIIPRNKIISGKPPWGVGGKEFKNLVLPKFKGLIIQKPGNFIADKLWKRF